MHDAEANIPGKSDRKAVNSEKSQAAISSDGH